MSYSTVGADSPDRDLILGPPISFRGARGKSFHDHPVSNVIVSARQISALFVTKLSEGENISDDRAPAVSLPQPVAAEEAAAPEQ